MRNILRRWAKSYLNKTCPHTEKKITAIYHPDNIIYYHCEECNKQIVEPIYNEF